MKPLTKEQKLEIRIALEERIERLKRIKDRCKEAETATFSPALKQEYKEMIKTCNKWIKDAKTALERINI